MRKVTFPLQAGYDTIELLGKGKGNSSIVSNRAFGGGSFYKNIIQSFWVKTAQSEIFEG